MGRFGSFLWVEVVYTNLNLDLVRVLKRLLGNWHKVVTLKVVCKLLLKKWGFQRGGTSDPGEDAFLPYLLINFISFDFDKTM